MSATTMTETETQSIRDDLAFLRGLVDRGDDFRISLGRTYFAGGLCYLGQTVLGLGQSLGWIPTTNGLLDLVIGIGPTAAFLVALTLLRVWGRENAPSGPADRAISAFFGAIGLSNFALIAVIGAVALREKSMTIWLIYPCTVFILQGAAWLTMFILRRRGWIGIVAALWFACALGMGWNVSNLVLYTSFASVGLLFGMTLPGAWLMTHKVG